MRRDAGWLGAPNVSGPMKNVMSETSLKTFLINKVCTCYFFMLVLALGSFFASLFITISLAILYHRLATKRA